MNGFCLLWRALEAFNGSDLYYCASSYQLFVQKVDMISFFLFLLSSLRPSPQKLRKLSRKNFFSNFNGYAQKKKAFYPSGIH